MTRVMILFEGEEVTTIEVPMEYRTTDEIDKYVASWMENNIEWDYE